MAGSLEGLCLGELTSVVYRQYQNYVLKKLEMFELNFSEYSILIKIPENEAVTQKVLADKLLYDNAIVTRSLKTLEKKGFIIRVKSSADKRAMLVSLSALGKEVKEKTIAIRRHWKEEVMANVSQKDEKKLFEQIKNIAQKALVVSK